MDREGDAHVVPGEDLEEPLHPPGVIHAIEDGVELLLVVRALIADERGAPQTISGELQGRLILRRKKPRRMR